MEDPIYIDMWESIFRGPPVKQYMADCISDAPWMKRTAEYE